MRKRCALVPGPALLAALAATTLAAAVVQLTNHAGPLHDLWLLVRHGISFLRTTLFRGSWDGRVKQMWVLGRKVRDQKRFLTNNRQQCLRQLSACRELVAGPRIQWRK